MNMNPTTSETNEPINITPMTVEEAKECDAEIHMHLDAADKHLDSAGALLLNMKRREGWKALDFGTWTEYLESRAAVGKSRRRALELLQAEEVRENLAMCGIPHMDIPTVTSQLTTLAQLPLSQQSVGLHKADQLAMTEGKKRTANHIAKAVKEIKSVAAEIEAKGKSLGLPTRGDSILPQSDRMDDLMHSSPADVDDRPGVLPLTPFEVLKNSARRGIQGYLSGMSETAVAQALAAVTTQAHRWEQHVDAVAHRFPHRDRIALRPAIIKVFWEIAQGRKTLTQSVDVMLPEILASHDNEYLPDILQAELEDDPQVAIAPTPAQWQAAQVKHAELLQALKEAQVEIEQLSAENLKLHEANDGLHNEIALLLTELAALKAPLQPQADA